MPEQSCLTHIFSVRYSATFLLQETVLYLETILNYEITNKVHENAENMALNRLR